MSFSPWSCKRVRHNLVTKQWQQLSFLGLTWTVITVYQCPQTSRPSPRSIHPDVCLIAHWEVQPVLQIQHSPLLSPQPHLITCSCLRVATGFMASSTQASSSPKMPPFPGSPNGCHSLWHASSSISFKAVFSISGPLILCLD